MVVASKKDVWSQFQANLTCLASRLKLAVITSSSDPCFGNSLILPARVRNTIPLNRKQGCAPSGKKTRRSTVVEPGPSETVPEASLSGAKREEIIAPSENNTLHFAWWP